MKTIGLIGGMSAESSALYYRLINKEMQRRLGGHHNPRSLLATVDFGDIVPLQISGEWDRLGEMLAHTAQQLERGGADFLVLCANTMHKVADSISRAVEIPLLHIVDPTANAIQQAGHVRVGLLATRYTMEQPFYADRMRARFGIEVLIPSSESRQVVHEIIFEELVRGIFRHESRQRYQEVIAELAAAGAQSIILGCTELELLLTAADSELLLHPSTTLHAMAAVEMALDGDSAS
jgi:aspartate racemase